MIINSFIFTCSLVRSTVNTGQDFHFSPHERGGQGKKEKKSHRYKKKEEKSTFFTSIKFALPAGGQNNLLVCVCVCAVKRMSV